MMYMVFLILVALNRCQASGCPGEAIIPPLTLNLLCHLSRHRRNWAFLTANLGKHKGS